MKTAREAAHALANNLDAACTSLDVIGWFHGPRCDVDTVHFAGRDAELVDQIAKWLESKAAKWLMSAGNARASMNHVVAWHRSRELEDVAARLRAGSWRADLATASRTQDDGGTA
ncbi:hypothetical protein [Phenylobacterium sp.]|uniref:hypothetical protein n=1 Tax=Phenylobacterium sp. TaxID=1871053 RepID=UPI0025EFC5CC|nr:hypothetical protein [Phenylobacterium sp.]